MSKHSRMATRRHLNKAPIVEALIDLRVPSNPAVDEDALRELRESLRASFPGEEAKRRREAQIKLTDSGHLESNVKDLGFHGLFLTSADKREILQLRPDGFTFSRLKPYTNWPDIRDRAFSYWTEYARITAPSTVVRVALRYINRMNIPFANGPEFHDYLVTAPVVPEKLPQMLGHFLTQMVMVDPRRELQANVTQALERGSAESMQVLLDIDVYRQHDELSTSLDDLRPVFEALHDFKNEIFFELLTDAALEAFE